MARAARNRKTLRQVAEAQFLDHDAQVVLLRMAFRASWSAPGEGAVPVPARRAEAEAGGEEARADAGADDPWWGHWWPYGVVGLFVGGTLAFNLGPPGAAGALLTRDAAANEDGDDNSDDEMQQPEMAKVPDFTKDFEPDAITQRALDRDKHKELFDDIVKDKGLKRFFTPGYLTRDAWNLPDPENKEKMWFDIAVLPLMQSNAEALLYVGTFRAGLMHGEGLIIASRGARPVAFLEFDKGFPHGNGVLFEDVHVIAKLRFDDGVLWKIERCIESKIGEFKFQSTKRDPDAPWPRKAAQQSRRVARPPRMTARPSTKVRSSAWAWCSQAQTRAKSLHDAPQAARVALPQVSPETDAGSRLSTQSTATTLTVSSIARLRMSSLSTGGPKRVFAAFHRDLSGTPFQQEFEENMTAKLGRRFTLESEQPEAGDFRGIADLVKAVHVVTPLLTPKFFKCKECLALLVFAQREMKSCVPVNVNNELGRARLSYMTIICVDQLLSRSDWNALDKVGILRIDVMSAIQWLLRRPLQSVEFQDEEFERVDEEISSIANRVTAAV
ncbi:Hypothetical Protein FCC1311_094112 [Hondaea fermentalgiana]|uniref:Uncharacterized protein n=1 Tax=Hondaea fermentalgiana TaxID=2315210 RepID=A0A2R5GQN8_9STRA|nr:Hypothetical Protein FCC1311_094112 [Hondaea fermentalgiana]|eukprot:GBG33187.1 Hypothetical Protein FCC1311_094112 [Hondaea fermentalgiana]